MQGISLDLMDITPRYVNILLTVVSIGGIYGLLAILIKKFCLIAYLCPNYFINMPF